MTQIKNYLVLGDRRFGFHFGSSYHIARQFAALDYRVGWVSYFLSPFHFAATQDRNEFRARLRLWRQGGTWQDEGRIWSYVPFTILPIVDRPVLRSRWVMHHSDRLTMPRLFKKMAEMGFPEAEVLWVDSSRYSFALDRIPHRISVFRPSEDITLIPNVAKTFFDHERSLLERADVVIAHSRVLIESYKKLTSRPIHFFPNAVDFDFFHSAPDALPDEYRSIPPPRVVCLGGMASPLIFDQDLIVHLARALPAASFVLLGRVYADVSRLKGLPNVHILGQRDYQTIPGYLKNAAAGIVPYKKSIYTERVGGDMLKLFEYMACGLPVVSLNFKELQQFPSPAALAGDYDEFARLLGQAIEDTDRGRYVDFARDNTWDKRFGELLELAGLSSEKRRRPVRKRPKVAVVHPWLHVGGGSEACVLWILDALKDDYALALITSNEVDFDEFNKFYKTNIRPGDVRRIRVRPARFFRSGKRFAALWGFRLNVYCKKNSPGYDVMFSAYNPMDFGRPGIQYILDPLFNNQMLKMLNPTPKKWRKWFYQDSPFRTGYLRFGEWLSAFDATGLKRNVTVVDSDWMGQLTKTGLGLDTRTLFPPVPGRFADVPWDEREDGFLCIGRIVPEKQIERVIHILAAVRADGLDVHLHIVGQVGDAGYARGLMSLARKSGDWATLETDISGDRKAELLSRHKYGIHGKMNEPFGITIAEKVKAGCLVWVPRGGGQVEIVDHPDLTYDSIPDGAAKILAVLNDQERQKALRAHLAKGAGRFSVERFQREVRDLVARFLHDHDGFQK